LPLDGGVKDGGGEGAVPSGQGAAVQLSVQHQVGIAPLLLMQQGFHRRGPRAPGPQRRSPALSRSPAAKALPSMGLEPSGTTCSSSTAPSPQATVRGFVRRTVPGASPWLSARRQAITLTLRPPPV